MLAGNTFLLGARSADIHLWVVISDPLAEPENVVLVSLTSWDRTKEQTCLIEVGDHPFVRHRTVVSYAAARWGATSHQLDQLAASGALRPHQPASQPLLDRIRLGAARSRLLPLDAWTILDRQGLLPE